MATVRELVTVWGFDVDMKPLERLDQAINTTKSALKTIALTAAAAGGTVFGLVKFTAHAGDEALKLSQKIGIGVEALQELSFAAELADVSAEQLQTSLRFLSRNAFEAAKGSQGALKPFADLGVRMRDSNGHLKSADTLLTELADKFSKLPDGTRKTALAVEVFGRSGENMIPFLNAGSKGIADLRAEAQALGVVMSEDQTRAAEEFNDNLKRVTTALIGVRNIVGNALIPVFNEAAIKVKEFIVVNRDMIAENVQQGAEILLDVFHGMLSIMRESIRIVRNLSEVFGGFGQVLKFAAFALNTFLAIKLSVGVGQGVIAVVQMTGALFAMGNAALIAQAKLLAIPLAVTAIIAAIALLVEDFLVFKAGGDSVIGLGLKAIGEVFDGLAAKFENLGGFGKGLVTALLTPLRLIINAFQTVKGLMDVIFSDKKVIDFLKETGSRIANTFVPGQADTLGAALGLPEIGATSASVGAGVSSSAFSSRQINVSQSSSMKVDVLGLPPEQAQATAKAAMQDGWETILRETGREASSQVDR